VGWILHSRIAPCVKIMSSNQMRTFLASCHCRSHQIEIQIPSDSPPTLLNCNCSICSKKGFIHLITPKSRFKLLKPESESKLSCYTFNTHIAKHLFCGICGICVYYIPRSNPDGVSVNYRCVEGANDEERKEVERWGSEEVRVFDGRNWEDNAKALGHLSKEDQ